MDVGDEAAKWVSRFLEKEGCRMYYMSPRHKPRVLLEDEQWTECCRPGEEVYMQEHISATSCAWNVVQEVTPGFLDG